MIYIDKEIPMFTLPVDYLPTVPENKLPGKIDTPNFWNLRVTVDPIVVVTQESDYYIDSPSLYHYNDSIDISIKFGSQSICTISDLKKSTTVEHDLVDNITPLRQNLVIEMSGKNEQQQVAPNHHLAVKLSLHVENLCIDRLFTEIGCYFVNYNSTTILGSTIMGNNGFQTLEIYTPIYVWLLQHRNYLDNF